jgi:hypothetical protein
VALYRLPRACCMVAVALCWALLAASTARGEDATQDRIAAGTLVCSERSAANNVMAIIHDPDAEDPVRRLTLILSSGEFTDHLVGEHYDTASVEEAGIVNARVRGLDVYLVTLTGNR